MARIKITDLPKNVQISREEMKKVFGGAAKSLTQVYANPLELTGSFVQGGSFLNPGQLVGLEPDPWNLKPSNTYSR